MLFDLIVLIIFSIIFFSPIIYILINFLQNITYIKIFLNSYFIYAFINSFILSFLSGSLVCFFGVFISLILVSLKSHSISQQILFLLSSITIVISPIIISLGYFIILGNLRYILFVNYILVILINCVLILPFAIIILFTRLKNIFLNYDDLKKSFNLNDIDLFKITFPLIKKNIIYLFSFSTAISFGDFAIISFFKNEKFQTLTSLLYKLISTYRFEEATFVAGFILFFSLIIYLFFDNKILYR